jgi:hypothetical protein
MPSTSEKGNAKNVANFSKLITVCKGFGTKYNPSKTAIKILNLDAKLVTLQNQLQNIKDTAQAENTARNNRRVGFNNYNKFSTRVLGAFKATDATQESIDDAISINKKIQGERITDEPKAKPKAEGEEPSEDDTISTSQKSYTNIVDHFKKFKTLLVSQAAFYTPNEADLQITVITAYINNLETLNNLVDTAETAASNSRIARNHSFYDDKTGIVDIANAVKDYVKSVYNAGSPEHKLVTAIPFTKPPKK